MTLLLCMAFLLAALLLAPGLFGLYVLWIMWREGRLTWRGP